MTGGQRVVLGECVELGGQRFLNNRSFLSMIRVNKTGGCFFMVICDKAIYVDNFVWNVVSLCAQKNE